MSESQLYRALAKEYGWTPQQIADLTPAQQLEFLKPDEELSGIAHFRTGKEYEQWMANRATK